MSSDPPLPPPPPREPDLFGTRTFRSGAVRDHVETRKVQAIRGSTHLVSLPKRWVDQLGISAGTVLQLHLCADGSILISPPAERVRTPLHVDILVQSTEDDHVARELIAAYIAGCESIRLCFPPAESARVDTIVRNALERLQGLVVVEGGPGTLLLQDLLDPTEFDATKGLRRMHLEARAMLAEATRIVTSPPTPGALAALERHENEIDRMRFLLLKQQNRMTRDLSYAKGSPITLEESLNHVLVGEYLERVGDYALRIAHWADAGGRLTGAVETDRARGVTTLVTKALDDAMASFHRKEEPLAHGTVELIDKIRHLTQEVLPMVVSAPKATTGGCGTCIAYVHVFECYERIGLYAKSIAEVAINRTVADRARRENTEEIP